MTDNSLNKPDNAFGHLFVVLFPVVSPGTDGPVSGEPGSVPNRSGRGASVGVQYKGTGPVFDTAGSRSVLVVFAPDVVSEVAP